MDEGSIWIGSPSGYTRYPVSPWESARYDAVPGEQHLPERPAKAKVCSQEVLWSSKNRHAVMQRLPLSQMHWDCHTRGTHASARCWRTSRGNRAQHPALPGALPRDASPSAPWYTPAEALRHRMGHALTLATHAPDHLL